MANILLIGNGGREHAIAWKLNQSSLLNQLYVWPEHPALQDLANESSLPNSDSTFDEIADFCEKAKISAVIVGPEHFLEKGLADTLQKRQIPCFGPMQKAAELEASKSFAKSIMQKAKVPTAAFHEVRTKEECKKISLDILGKNQTVVLKASGLAGGKGVFIVQSLAQLDEALSRLYIDMKSASEIVLIEEFLEGRECSYFCFLGNGEYTPLGFAVDYKKLNDGDQGPNTGGMGSYPPVTWLPTDAQSQVEQVVIAPLLETLRQEKIPYTGWLYVGLMWHPSRGPQVVEFNCRLGDPEAQILAVADNRDWLNIVLYHLGLQERPKNAAKISLTPTVGVVMTSTDYPYKESDPGPASEFPKKLFEFDYPKQIFTAAVSKNDASSIRTGRGRVFTCVAKASSIDAARNQAYVIVDMMKVNWQNCHYRTDIGNV